MCGGIKLLSHSVYFSMQKFTEQKNGRSQGKFSTLLLIFINGKSFQCSTFPFFVFFSFSVYVSLHLSFSAAVRRDAIFIAWFKKKKKKKIPKHCFQSVIVKLVVMPTAASYYASLLTSDLHTLVHRIIAL